jgi:cytochrome bd ubiquinol oxidase subunit II
VVGILLPLLGRDDTERRMMINSIGPVWDGNEVWLLTAGGATFAAFPLWYASMFSGFYLALLIILVALIVRGVCFEFRSKVDSPRWRANWDRAIFAGSAVPALLWGVAFANIVRGVPMNAAHVYTGNLFTLLNWYGLLGGLVTLSLFTLHGAIFLVMTWVALIFTPVVLAYQGWTYWVFRQRLSRSDFARGGTLATGPDAPGTTDRPGPGRTQPVPGQS